MCLLPEHSMDWPKLKDEQEKVYIEPCQRGSTTIRFIEYETLQGCWATGQVLILPKVFLKRWANPGLFFIYFRLFE